MNPLRIITGAVVAILLLVIGIQHAKISSLSHWQDRAVSALSVAGDVRDKHGRPARLSKSEALKQIDELGQFVRDVRLKRETQRADDSQHVVTVERKRNQVSQEESHGYQTSIADARRRAAALRVHARPVSPAPAGVIGNPPVPGSGDAARGPDGAAVEDGLSPEDRLLCTEQSLRLKFLQEWEVRQEAIDPPPVIPPG